MICQKVSSPRVWENMLVIHDISHLDHGLSPEHLAWLQEVFSDRDGFFRTTVDVPPHLPELASALWGPAEGDPPVEDADVEYVIRPGRRCASRILVSPLATLRPTRRLSVVAGPYEGKPCVLYTAYGGAAAPREPGDLTIYNWEGILESRAFWAEHALAGSDLSNRAGRRSL